MVFIDENRIIYSNLCIIKVKYFSVESRRYTMAYTMAYIIGNRNQNTLFPSAIEDYVGTEDPVRSYDAFV
jgi:hypothetical protein